MSRGNHPEGPRGGKETPSHEPLEGNMPGTPRPETVSTKQRRIAKLARNAPDLSFTTLAHHIDIVWLRKAYALTRKDGAVGVDGQTAEEYEVNLKDNLQDLLNRAKSGTYVAPPVRRVHIPKAGSPGETRPLGIPCIKDRVVQMAVVLVLEPIFEADLEPEQHAYRPDRSALDAVRQVHGLAQDGAYRGGGRRPYRATSRWHLDALLKTQGVELPCPELPELGEGLGGVGEQIQLPFGVERDLDRAVVDAVVDPAPFESQLRGELRYRQEARDLPRVRLPAVAEQAVTEPNDLHGAA